MSESLQYGAAALPFGKLWPCYSKGVALFGEYIACLGHFAMEVIQCHLISYQRSVASLRSGLAKGISIMCPPCLKL